MTTPNDSFQSNPDASGTLLATHLVGTKEYPVVMQAGPSGHILDSLDSYIACADNIANAANKQMFSIFNGTGSGKVLKIRKLFYVQTGITAVAGVATRMEWKKTTAQSAGTAITALAFDTNNAAVPAQISIAHAATVTESSLIFPFASSSEEVAAAGTLSIQGLTGLFNLLPEAHTIQDWTLREGQGVTLKNITTTVGTATTLCVFTLE